VSTETQPSASRKQAVIASNKYILRISSTLTFAAYRPKPASNKHY
jgi:hypothetical protein